MNKQVQFPWLGEFQAELRLILQLSRKRNTPVYLVGGIVRDIFLGRRKKTYDFDFCLPADAIGFTREAAKLLSAGFVELDKVHGCARAVKKTSRGLVTFDFSDFRGKNLQDDLLHRDFTVNSMAVALDKLLCLCGRKNACALKRLKEVLIDPYGGIVDLDKKLIRQVHVSGFDEDPLRILRAFSLAAIFDFSVHQKTLETLRAKIRLLDSVSPERIRDELFKIMETPRAYETLRKIDTHGILDAVFPEIKKMRKLRVGQGRYLDVWKHSFETLRHLEGILTKPKQNVLLAQYIHTQIIPYRCRYELIKLAGLLHDLGKPGTLRMKGRKIQFHGHERAGAHLVQEIGIRLKLSNDEINFLKRIVLFHLRPGYLADTDSVSRRAGFRFFRDTGQEAVSVLLVSLADQRATKGALATKESRARHERLVRRFIANYFQKEKAPRQKRLVDGFDLQRRFKLPPSALIGKLLREIEESQAIGAIKTKAQAFAIAAKYIRNA